MKIRIVKSKSRHYWYSDKLNTVHNVKDETQTDYILFDGRGVLKDDASICDNTGVLIPTNQREVQRDGKGVNVALNEAEYLNNPVQQMANDFMVKALTEWWNSHERRQSNWQPSNRQVIEVARYLGYGHLADEWEKDLKA